MEYTGLIYCASLFAYIECKLTERCNKNIKIKKKNYRNVCVEFSNIYIYFKSKWSHVKFKVFILHTTLRASGFSEAVYNLNPEFNQPKGHHLEAIEHARVELDCV